jgi:hypothetical protein
MQTAPLEDLSPYRIAQEQVDQAARHLPDLQPGLLGFMKRTARMIVRL